MAVADTNLTKMGDPSIADQVLGEGGVDAVVLIPRWRRLMVGA